MAPMHSYCIIHPGSQLDDSKFQYDSTQVKIEVPSSDSSGDPYDDGMCTGTGEEDVIVFDHVFPPKTSQEQIFKDVARSHVRNALQTFQSAIFIASGATGSGKTFAVTGGAQRFSDRGLIPRSVSALFEAMGEDPDEDVEVSVSFYELYKDAVVDLLSERRRKVPIKATENGPQLIGLLRQVVATESDAYHLLFQGDSNRHFQSFAQNSETSRGHVFYLLHVHHRVSGKRAVLAFVDLAAAIAVRNPANTAIAQSLDALKATLLALRDGREAFWESAILPQLLESWLSPKSNSTVVLLSPVRYSSEMHQEAHEWLTFTRLAQEAYSGSPLPSQLQKNWTTRDGKVGPLQLPASFQERKEEPGVVEVKEEAKQEAKQEPGPEAKQEPEQEAEQEVVEKPSREPPTEQVSQVSHVSYQHLPSQTSIRSAALSQATVPTVPSQPSSGRKGENGTTEETEGQKALSAQASQASERGSKPGDWSPEGPRVTVEASMASTPPGSGRKLVKALSPSMTVQATGSQPQQPSGMVTPPPVSTKPAVSPLPGARSPISAAIDLLREGGGERMAKVLTQPVGSPDNRPNGAAVPPVQAMPPARHMSPLRQIMTKQVSVVPPVVAPGSPGDAKPSAPSAPSAMGRVATAPPTATAPHVQRPSTLAVQHQQKEMQYLHNLKRHVPLAPQGSAPPFVRSPSPPGGRQLRPGTGTQSQAPAEVPQVHSHLQHPNLGQFSAHPSPVAGFTSFVPHMPQAGLVAAPMATTATGPTGTTTPMAPGTTTPMAPGTTTPMAPGTTTPMAPGTTTPMAGGAPCLPFMQAYARTESPMAYPTQVRSLSPMARPVAVTAATPMRYGAFVQPFQGQHPQTPAAQPVRYGAVMMGRDALRPQATQMAQVPLAFKVAPPVPQATVLTPRKAAAEAASKQPSRSVSPLPAGTMERVVRARQENK